MRSLPTDRLVPVLLLAAASLGTTLVGCDDDPAKPNDGLTPPSPWSEVSLGSDSTGVELLSIDCEGAECLVTGQRILTKRADPFPGSETVFFERSSEGTWSAADLAELPAETYRDGALGADGDPVVVGWGFDGSSPYGALYDGRTAKPTSVVRPAVGLLTVDGSGDFFVAGGASQGGVLLSSFAPGSWNTDDVPTTGLNDGGFEDVYVRGDVAVACGYDDGADTLQVMLRRTASTPWQHVNRNGLAFALSLQCIAVDDGGKIYVGGIEGAGSPDAKAFLFVRDIGGVWTNVELPDPQALGGVNDICIADDGSVYLACGGETVEAGMAQILRVVGTVVSAELTPFEGNLDQIAQTQDGTLFAVGGRMGPGSRATTGVLLQRTP